MPGSILQLLGRSRKYPIRIQRGISLLPYVPLLLLLVPIAIAMPIPSNWSRCVTETHIITITVRLQRAAATPIVPPPMITAPSPSAAPRTHRRRHLHQISLAYQDYISQSHNDTSVRACNTNRLGIGMAPQPNE